MGGSGKERMRVREREAEREGDREREGGYKHQLSRYLHRPCTPYLCSQ